MSVILIGKNSNLYKNYKDSFNSFVDIAISASDLESYSFNENDSLIILSYGKSKKSIDLLAYNLSSLNVKFFLLISTCTTVVLEKTKCYAYPAIKQYQERLFVQKLKNVSILSVGTIVDEKADKEHHGTCITKATVFFKICEDIIRSTQSKKYLVEYEFSKFSNESSVEYKIFRAYKSLITLLPLPCLLRPLDILLKYFGCKWYGYGVLTTILLEKKHGYRV